MEGILPHETLVRRQVTYSSGIVLDSESGGKNYNTKRKV